LLCITSWPYQVLAQCLQVARVYTSVGAVALTIYQVVYTLPRWQQLVAEPFQKGQTSLMVILGLYLVHAGTERVFKALPFATSVHLAWLHTPTDHAVHAVLFVLHNQVNSITIQKNGLLAVSIVNASRSVVMAAISHVYFCTPDKPLQCLNKVSAISSAIIAAGALTWALAGACVCRCCLCTVVHL
jgi:hypothetical protein